MPNGKWAAYDQEYYLSIARSWTQRTTQDVDRSRQRDVNAANGDNLQEVSAMDEASRTRAEIESRKDLTADVIRSGPKLPNMQMTVRSSFSAVACHPCMEANIPFQASRMSGTARQRHQLSTLLMDAYTHRAEIEDKIAQAKRNRKESGNKYGEATQIYPKPRCLSIILIGF